MEEVIDSGANMVAANCPFCITMLSDGAKAKNKEEDIMVYDISEMILQGRK
jgi:Fe-S oxidoreductase